MKAFDRYLRNVRINKARRFLKEGDAVVDIGCADGAMFKQWAGIMGQGYGVDPTLSRSRQCQGFTLYAGRFPDVLPSLKCDLITMLAVLEHIPPDQQSELVTACHQMLKPNGRVVITVPSPRVDDILSLLSTLRIIDGMSLEEHYGFDVESTVDLFQGAFKLRHRQQFQLGLNNLFVFEKNA